MPILKPSTGGQGWIEKHRAFNGGVDIMIDVESFGECIPSLAIVPFDLATGECMPAKLCIILTLDINWQQERGLLCDQSTLRWWMQQGDEARDALFNLPDSRHCKLPIQVGMEFDIIKEVWGIRPEEDHHRVWGKPGSYDWPKMERLCKAARVQMPFHFRTSRCLRTMKELCGTLNNEERNKWKIDNNIISHNPYDDCRLQAWEAFQMMKQHKNI